MPTPPPDKPKAAAVMSRYAAVLLDCDGVLVDSEPVWFEILTSLTSRSEHRASFSQDEITGKSLAECIQLIERRSGHRVAPDFADEFRARARELPSQAFTPVPGAVELVRHLVDEAALPIAVVSNSPAMQVRKALRGAGLADLVPFDRVVTGPEHHTFKPDPELYHIAAGLLGVSAADCLVVEDSDSGVVAGLESGATVLHLAPRQVDPPPTRYARPSARIHAIRLLADAMLYLDSDAS